MLYMAREKDKLSEPYAWSSRVNSESRSIKMSEITVKIGKTKYWYKKPQHLFDYLNQLQLKAWQFLWRETAIFWILVEKSRYWPR